MKDTLTNTYYRYMGRLKITLKKAKNKNGFVITDIKRVRTENVNIKQIVLDYYLNNKQFMED